MQGKSTMTKGVAFRVPNETLKTIHDIARSKDISFSNLMRKWLSQCLESEQTHTEQIADKQ